mmetsp:Transcript_59785/g.153991  ORF Transcript_59785/g.153991 Transcript_59785/m.153991 type:complete len:660 (+) Transcript_59785:175-2154(+)
MQRKAAAKAQKWVPKGADENCDEGYEESPILPMKSEGPCFDKILMLKVYEASLKSKEEGETALDVSLSQRPVEEEKKTSGTRLSQRDAKKAAQEETPGGAYGEGAHPDAHPGEAAAYEMHMAYMQWLHSMSFAGMAFGPPGPNGYTTVMLRNIPNRYTRDMLAERLDETHKGQYDFVYLPIDFNSKCNIGYSFINFRSAEAAVAFMQEFHGKRTKSVLPGFSSAKVVEVSYARVQGRDANMDNLKDEKFIEKLSERPEWQPLFLDEDGLEVPFSKTLGAGSAKRKSGRAGGATPAGGWPAWPMPMMYPPPLMPIGRVTLSSVLPAATAETMRMLKEVPTSLAPDDLLKRLNESHKGSFDFVYLPKDTLASKDAKTECNRGRAYINFRTKEQAEQFTKDFHDVKVSVLFPGKAEDEEKTCQVTNARLHSLESSLAKAQASKFKVAPGGHGERWGAVLLAPEGAATPFPLLTQGQAEAWTPEPEGEETGKGKKGEGKGKTPKTAKTPAGYPGHQPQAYMSHMMAMQKMAMSSMAAQHTAAHAAAAKHAYSSIGGPPASPSKQSRKPLSDDVKHSLKKQVEFYFSLANLCKDVFLRQHMDARTGYVALELLAAFPKVMKLNATATHIAEVLESSETLELDESKTLTRLRGEEERRRWMATQA